MRSLVVFGGGYDGQIGFRVSRGDEIFRLERVRARNGGGQACELVREMVGGGTWWRIRPTCELWPWKHGEERAYFQLDWRDQKC